MKVFISQPMNGLPDDLVLHERMKIIYRLHIDPIDVINSFIKEVPEGAGRIWCLGDSIRLMDQADLVVFHKDWKKARGCRIEHDVCMAYKIPYVEMEEEQ